MRGQFSPSKSLLQGRLYDSLAGAMRFNASLELFKLIASSNVQQTNSALQPRRTPCYERGLASTFIDLDTTEIPHNLPQLFSKLNPPRCAFGGVNASPSKALSIPVLALLPLQPQHQELSPTPPRPLLLPLPSSPVARPTNRPHHLLCPPYLSFQNSPTPNLRR